MHLQFPEFGALFDTAQSYQPKIPENFRFSEPKILFVIEATLLVKKMKFG